MDEFSAVIELGKRLDSGVSVDQICRTCPKGPQKRLLKCEPVEPRLIKRVHTDRSVSIVPKVTRQAPSGAGGWDPVELVRKPAKSVQVLVESCGAGIQDKCRKCTHFVPLNVEIKVDGWKPEIAVGGHCRLVDRCERQVLVRDTLSAKSSCATCAFSAMHNKESMIEAVTPVQADLTPYEFWLANQIAAPEDVGLMIYLMRQSKGQCLYPRTPKAVRAQIKAAGRRIEMSLAWTGLQRFFSAPIVKIHMEGDREVAYDIRSTAGVISTVRLDESDDRVGLVTRFGDKVIMQILSPHHRDYGFSDNDKWARPKMPTETCPKCAGTGTVQRLGINKVGNAVFLTHGCETCGGKNNPGSYKPMESEGSGEVIRYPKKIVQHQVHMERVDSNCNSGCSTRWGPCYFHAKKPVHKEVIEKYFTPDGTLNGAQFIDTLVFEDVAANMDVVSDNPAGVLHVDENGDVVDANGATPEVAVFTVQLRSLLSHTKTAEAWKNIMNQFWALQGQCDYSKARATNLAWTMLATEDPFHPYCSLNAYDKTHGGHPQGSSDIIEKDNAGDVEVHRGVLTRGRDLAHIWNDSYGTPRGDMSTNPVLNQNGVKHSVEGVVIGDWDLRRDPKYSATKAMDLEEWIRVHNTGELLYEEDLINEALIKVSRPDDSPWNPSGVYHFPKEMMHKPLKRTKLDPGIPGNQNVTRSTTAELYEFLNEQTWMDGNDLTTTGGFNADQRFRFLGYTPYHMHARGKPLPKAPGAGDIPSVFLSAMNPTNDAKSPEQEAHEIMVCSLCYTGDGDIGQWRADEVTGPNCPDPECSGMLVNFARGQEWLAATMKISPDVIRILRPTYRKGSPTMAAAADSRSWQSSQRLQESVCENWVPKKRKKN